MDWAALATVIAFPTLRRRDMQPTTIDIGAKTMARRPTPDRKSVTAALDEFVAEVIAAEPGAAIPVAELYDLYAVTRRVRRMGWPAATQRALVARLTAAGCRRKQLDLRSEGMGRPIVYVMPGELEIAA